MSCRETIIDAGVAFKCELSEWQGHWLHYNETYGTWQSSTVTISQAEIQDLLDRVADLSPYDVRKTVNESLGQWLASAQQ